MIAGGSKCALAGEGHRCVGVIQWHHVFPKSRLKREFKYGAYWNAQAKTWKPRFRTDTDRYLALVGLPGPYKTLDDIIADPRNRMWLCSEGAHEPVTNARLHLAVPESVWAFAAEFGLTAQLENDLARRAA